jgi:predicted short-subunit dehydrogenase-like oxidoreductase (DUF2520 family)
MRGASSSHLQGLHVGLVGSGAAARDFSRRLRAQGATVHIYARQARRAQGLGTRAASLRELAQRCELVLLCVRDGALEELTQALAQSVLALSKAQRPRAVLHVSGVTPRSILEPLAHLGIATGVLHPLLSLPRQTRSLTKASLPAAYACQGNATALRYTQRLVKAFGARALRVQAGRELDYHLAAFWVANGALALFEVARESMERSVGKGARTREAFAALLESVAHNLHAAAPAKAQSGPIARGDEATVAGHWKALPKQRRALYRELARVLLEISSAEPAAKRGIARVLKQRS